MVKKSKQTVNAYIKNVEKQLKGDAVSQYKIDDLYLFKKKIIEYNDLSQEKIESILNTIIQGNSDDLPVEDMEWLNFLGTLFYYVKQIEKIRPD